MSDGGVAVLGASWTRAPRGEMATAVRSIAGALSRLVAVHVYVPGNGPPAADGAFDLTPVGSPGRAEWPAALPGSSRSSRYRAVVVEAGDAGASDLAASMTHEAAVLSVGRSDGLSAGRPDGAPGALLAVDVATDDAPADRPASSVHRVGLYSRVDPGARSRRHYGLRSIPDYVLVLGDRPGAPPEPWPSSRVRWMLARFPRSYLVVVEGGVAGVWRSRSCVAAFDVHTRMDLWILMARALGVVDLLPGEVFARECVESLRFGVPIVVPAGSSAAGFARSGGALRFSSTAELFSCVEALFDRETRGSLAWVGSAVADRWYGDVDGLVTRLGHVLASLEDGHV